MVVIFSNEVLNRIDKYAFALTGCPIFPQRAKEGGLGNNIPVVTKNRYEKLL